MNLRKRFPAFALRAGMAFTAVVLLAIFLRVIRVEFSSSSVQISSAGFQAVVSWDSSKPMVADESGNVKFFVEGAPHSDDSAGAFFSHSLGGKVEARLPDGDSLTYVHEYNAAGNLTQLGANIWEIDASTLLTYGDVNALNQVTKVADSYGYGTAVSPYLVTHTNAGGNAFAAVVDSFAFTAGVTCFADNAFAAEVSSLQTVRDHRDSCRTPTRNDGWDNSISSMVGGFGLSLDWSSSVASDELELFGCRLGQLLSLFTDRSAKERLTSSVVVQQNQHTLPISLVGRVLFPPSFVPAFFLRVQPAVF